MNAGSALAVSSEIALMVRSWAACVGSMYWLSRYVFRYPGLVGREHREVHRELAAGLRDVARGRGAQRVGEVDAGKRGHRRRADRVAVLEVVDQAGQRDHLGRLAVGRRGVEARPVGVADLGPHAAGLHVRLGGGGRRREARVHRP
jgi:hypothetical protein